MKTEAQKSKVIFTLNDTIPKSQREAGSESKNLVDVRPKRPPSLTASLVPTNTSSTGLCFRHFPLQSSNNWRVWGHCGTHSWKSCGGRQRNGIPAVWCMSFCQTVCFGFLFLSLSAFKNVFFFEDFDFGEGGALMTHWVTPLTNHSIACSLLMSHCQFTSDDSEPGRVDPRKVMTTWWKPSRY